MFAGQIVGIREVEDGIWLVSFLEFDSGFFDQDEGRVEPAPNPFGSAKVLTVSPEWTLQGLVAGVGFEPTTFGL